MMKILVEDKPKTCSECLFCKRPDIRHIEIDSIRSLKIHKCSLLDCEIMNPSRVRITDCPLKELKKDSVR